MKKKEALHNERKYAFVQHKDKTVLMPILYDKAWSLLRCKKAKMVRKYPLTIRLNYETTKNIQDLTIGIDTGAIYIGYSVICPSSKKEYIRGTLEQEHLGNNSNPAKARMDNKRMYRRNRRGRLWYREARFDNRKKRDGILPPTIERKYQTHLRLIEKIEKLLPIKHHVVEVAKFDIQKIMNPDIQGTEYQQGDLYGYNDMRQYLLCREQGRCQFCKESFEGRSVHIHHIIPRSQGGTNRPNNLAILHKGCHEKVHKENLLGMISKPRLYKESAFMSMINRRFWEDLSGIKVTYGSVTFTKRNEYGIEKSHSNDAFIIAGGDNTFSRSVEIDLAQKRRNNRCLQKNNLKASASKTGRRVRKGRNLLHSGDMVMIDNQWHECKGMTGGGRQVFLGFEMLSNGKKKSITKVISKVQKAYFRSGIYFK